MLPRSFTEAGAPGEALIFEVRRSNFAHNLATVMRSQQSDTTGCKLTRLRLFWCHWHRSRAADPDGWYRPQGRLGRDADFFEV